MVNRSIPFLCALSFTIGVITIYFSSTFTEGRGKYDEYRVNFYLIVIRYTFCITIFIMEILAKVHPDVTY